MKYRNIIFCIILLIASCNYQKKNSSLGTNDSIELSNNPPIELEMQSGIKKIEVSDYAVRGDTLWILSGDDFLYYPFGVRKTMNELSVTYPFMKQQRLSNNDIPLYNLYFNQSSIVAVTDKQTSEKVEIVYAKISNFEIVLTNGIRVGVDKPEFINYLPISLSKSEWDKINIVLLESELLGVWNYYYFSNNMLDSILFRTDYQYDLSKMKF